MISVNHLSKSSVNYPIIYLVSSQDGVHALRVEARREVAAHAAEAPANVAEAVLDEHVLVHTVAD